MSLNNKRLYIFLLMETQKIYLYTTMYTDLEKHAQEATRKFMSPRHIAG
jgi:hypothetical protein